MARPAQGDPDSDTDSALGDCDTSTLGTSLDFSKFQYVRENGRLYLDDRRLLPADPEEKGRLDKHHALYVKMLGGELHTAPLKHPMRILDVGTGTGNWALDMADLYPAAKVIGIDISPIQSEWTASNCSFIIDDAEKDWIYEAPFDYVHGRSLSDVFSDWPRFYAQVFANLRPGAWFEIQDYHPRIMCDDRTLETVKWTNDWNDRVIQGFQQSGRSLNTVSHHKDRMSAAGFEDIRERIIKVPIGGWAKDPRLKVLGYSHVSHLVDSVYAFTPAVYTRVLGFTPEDTKKAMDCVTRELSSRGIHCNKVPTRTTYDALQSDSAGHKASVACTRSRIPLPSSIVDPDGNEVQLIQHR